MAPLFNDFDELCIHSAVLDSRDNIVLPNSVLYLYSNMASFQSNSILKIRFIKKPIVHNKGLKISCRFLKQASLSPYLNVIILI